MKKKSAGIFDNFEIEPSAIVWKRIEEKLPAKKKRRWFILWILSGLLLIVAGWQLLSGNHESVSLPGKENISDVSVQNQSTAKNKNISESASSVPEKNTEKSISGNNAENLQKNIPDRKMMHKAGYDNSKINDSKTISTNTIEKEPDIMNSNLPNEEMKKLSGINYSLAETGIEYNVADKKVIPENNKKVLTRWSIFLGSGITYSNSHKKSTSGEDDTGNIQGIRDVYFGVGVGYDMNQRIKLSLGVSLLTAGLERSASTPIFLKGPPGDPNHTYSFNSPIGNLSGFGSGFDHAYFSSPDSILFPVTVNATPINDSVKARYFTIREEFHYIEMPLMFIYKPLEGRVTPFAGVYFSTGYLLNHTVKINGNQLKYTYENGLSNFLFSAGFSAGADIHLSRCLSFFVNGFYQEGLNSVTNGENKWKPYVAGCSGGLSYRILK